MGGQELYGRQGKAKENNENHAAANAKNAARIAMSQSCDNVVRAQKDQRNNRVEGDLREPAQDLNAEKKTGQGRVSEFQKRAKLVHKQEDQRYPRIVLHECQMPGIEMSHEEAVVSENDG